MYYNRILETSLVSLSSQFPALLVTGPRQVGKTTLLKYLGVMREPISVWMIFLPGSWPKKTLNYFYSNTPHH